MKGSVNETTRADPASPTPLAHGLAASGVSRIVYVWPYIEWGGVQRYLISLMRRAVGAVQIDVVLPATSDPALIGELRQIGARCTFLRTRLSVSPPRSPIERVANHARRWQVEWDVWAACGRLASPGTVFHGDLFPPHFTWVLARLANRCGVVVTLHTGVPPVTSLRARAWTARLSVLARRPRFRLVAANRHVRDSLRPFVRPSALDAIPVAYECVDLAEIADARAHGPSRAEARRLVASTERRFLVVTGAQFIERKGCWVLVEAARRVRETAEDVDFVWVGPAPPSGEVEARLRASGSALRYVPHAALGEGRRPYLGIVGAADLFVLPSLEEGLPLALLEAMALGVPVVTTPVNAIPEAVADEREGLLVPPGDPGRLADAILRLRRDEGLRRALAEAGPARARSFDSDETARVTFEVYRDVVARGGGQEERR